VFLISYFIAEISEGNGFGVGFRLGWFTRFRKGMAGVLGRLKYTFSDTLTFPSKDSPAST